MFVHLLILSGLANCEPVQAALKQKDWLKKVTIQLGFCFGKKERRLSAEIQKPIAVVQMRPTFVVKTKLSAEEAMNQIRSRVLDTPHDFEGQFTSRHAMISFTKSKQHFWSPWLHLDIRSNESPQEIFGRFSPNPSIWTGIIFSYLAIAVLIFFAIVFGLSQQLAGENSWAYYFVPVGAIAAVMIWIASKVGQKLSLSQMREMRELIDGCFAENDNGAV